MGRDVTSLILRPRHGTSRNPDDRASSPSRVCEKKNLGLAVAMIDRHEELTLREFRS
jgi:hypothetical protein